MQSLVEVYFNEKLKLETTIISKEAKKKIIKMSHLNTRQEKKSTYEVWSKNKKNLMNIKFYLKYYSFYWLIWI